MRPLYNTPQNLRVTDTQLPVHSVVSRPLTIPSATSIRYEWLLGGWWRGRSLHTQHRCHASKHSYLWVSLTYGYRGNLGVTPWRFIRIIVPVLCLRVLVAVIKHHEQKLPGEERVYFDLQSLTIIRGSEGRNLGAGTGEGRRGMLHTALLSLLSDSNQDHQLRGGPSHISQETSPKACPQANPVGVCVWAFFYLSYQNDSSLCQMDIRPTRTSFLLTVFHVTCLCLIYLICLSMFVRVCVCLTSYSASKEILHTLHELNFSAWNSYEWR